jgi:hypothetical protein
MTFLAKKVIGTANITTIKVNGLLKLDLCSWGEMEATLIKKISSPPINTIT